MIIEVCDNKFVVVRLPVLMEDEGNWHIEAICDTRIEVAKFCKRFIENGYFHLSDLCYIGSYFSNCAGVPQDLRKYLPINIREHLLRIKQLLKKL